MKSNLKHWYGVIAVVSIIVGFMAGSVSQVYAEENSNPGIIPPNVKAYLMTYGEWSAKWQQWNLSLPNPGIVGTTQNPSYDGSVSEPPSPLDKPGECSNGANGQIGPVWFLTGVINDSGKAVRDCTVPAGKALFFPIINVECSTLEAPPFYGKDERDLRACVNSDLFNFGGVFAYIDGVKV